MSLLFLACLALGQGPIPSGSAKLELDVAKARLEVFTYKPADYNDGPLILVFHGVLRNAEEYRDHARGMGDRFRALIVAPRFPEDRFPIPSYQLGGLKLDGPTLQRAGQFNGGVDQGRSGEIERSGVASHSKEWYTTR